MNGDSRDPTWAPATTETPATSQGSEDLQQIVRFDSHRLRDVSDGDQEFEKELIEIYKGSCDEKIPLLEKALKEEHKENSILYSHDLKGASSNIGAEQVRAVSARLEKLAREECFKEALAVLPQLKTVIEEVKVVFDEYLSSGH